MDFVLAVGGLAFILLSGLAFCLSRHPGRWTTWVWMCGFGLTHGISQWIDMNLMVFPGQPLLSTLGILTLTSSFVMLLEFARTQWSTIYRHTPGPWMHLPILAFVPLFVVFGPDAIRAAASYFIGFPAAIACSTAWMVQARQQADTERDWSRVLALCFGLYAITAGLVAPHTILLPTHHFNPATFLSQFGVPVQLVRTILGICIALACWQMNHQRRSLVYHHAMRSVSRTEWALLAGLATLVIGGWHVVNRNEQQAGQQHQDLLLAATKTAAAALDPVMFTSLAGTPADMDSPAYWEIRRQLAAMWYVMRDYNVRWLYTMGIRSNQVVFTAESTPQNDPAWSPPGEAYTDPPPELCRAFHHGKASVSAPYSDAWGHFVSAFVPIQHPQTLDVVAVMGCDVNYTTWIDVMHQARLPGLLTMLGLASVLVLGLVMHQLDRENHQRLQLLYLAIEHAREGIVVSGLDGRVAFVNAAWAIQHGYRNAPELIDTMVARFHPEPNRREVVKIAGETKRDGAFEGVVPHVRKDGTTFPAWMNVSPLTDEHGEIYGYIATARDITEQQRAQESLRRSEERFRTLFDHASDAIFIHDFKDTILEINQSACDRLGYSRDQLLRMKPYEVDAPEQQPYFKERMELLKNEGRSVFETMHRRQDGTLIPVEVHARLITFGGQPAILSAARDITERNHAEAERREMEQQLLHAQKLESLGVLAGGIAHDFNNILMAILGNTDMVCDDLPPQSNVLPLMEEIRLATRRAANLCRQLLAYAGKGRLLVQAIDLNTVIHETVTLLTASVSKKVHIETNLQSELPRVNGDPVQVQQIVLNLILNGAEAIGQRSGTVTITTTTLDLEADSNLNGVLKQPVKPGTYIALAIADTGAGIPPDIIERIFEPFFTTKFTGRGLGLSAVLGIIRSHRGNLAVQSKPGSGTTFTVFLPAAPSTGLPTPASPERPDLSNPPDLTGHTFLLVDDEPQVRVIGKRMLSRLGCTVLTASNGREAVTLYRHHHAIDGVLLDLNMPDMGGEKVLQTIQTIRSTVPIILMSGYEERDIAPRFVGRGLAAFIHKPFSHQELHRVLNIILSGDTPATPPLNWYPGRDLNARPAV